YLRIDLGIKVHNRLGDRADHIAGDCEIGELGPPGSGVTGVRVIELEVGIDPGYLREVAEAHFIGRDGVSDVRAAPVAEILVGGEKEEFIFDDASTERAPISVPRLRRPRQRARIIEEAVGVQTVTVVELES